MCRGTRPTRHGEVDMMISQTYTPAQKRQTRLNMRVPRVPRNQRFLGRVTSPGKRPSPASRDACNVAPSRAGGQFVRYSQPFARRGSTTLRPPSDVGPAEAAASVGRYNRGRPLQPRSYAHDRRYRARHEGNAGECGKPARGSGVAAAGSADCQSVGQRPTDPVRCAAAIPQRTRHPKPRCIRPARSTPNTSVAAGR